MQYLSDSNCLLSTSHLQQLFFLKMLSKPSKARTNQESKPSLTFVKGPQLPKSVTRGAALYVYHLSPEAWS